MKLFSVIKSELKEGQLVLRSSVADFNTKSRLLVPKSQEALVLVNGEMHGPFGSGQHTIDTHSLPILNRLLTLPFGGETANTAEVYFVNTTSGKDIKWGLPSQFPFHAQIGELQRIMHASAHGVMSVEIQNSRRFVETLMGTRSSYTYAQLDEYINGETQGRVREMLGKVLGKVSFLFIAEYLDDLSKAVQAALNAEMGEYGLRIPRFRVKDVHVNEEDYAAFVNAQDMKAQIEVDKQRIIQIALAEKVRMDSLGYNFADEKLAEILKAYAENQGAAASPAGMVAQLPVAFAFGSMLGQQTRPIIDSIVGDFSTKPVSFGQKTGENAKPAERSVVPEGPEMLEPEFPAPAGGPSVCKLCGSPLKTGARFCAYCAAPVPEEKKASPDPGPGRPGVARFCPACGSAKPDGARFCPAAARGSRNNIDGGRFYVETQQIRHILLGGRRACGAPVQHFPLYADPEPLPRLPLCLRVYDARLPDGGRGDVFLRTAERELRLRHGAHRGGIRVCRDSTRAGHPHHDLQRHGSQGRFPHPTGGFSDLRSVLSDAVRREGQRGTRAGQG